MSVVAWDGKSIAADKQGTCAGMRITTTKLRRLNTGEVLAWTALQGAGELVAKWYEEGADPQKWPACQNDKEDWARLVIVMPDRRVITYERMPVSWAIEDPFMAWGAGRDYAIGAMARGASAREAVEIACRFDHTCGMGIDEVRFE